MDDCRLHADSMDDVLSVGAWAPKNRHGICCARLDDFDWVGPPYEPDMVLPEREMDVGIPDVGRDICVLPDEFPVVVVWTAVEPLSSPVERNGEVDIVDTRWDIQNLPDVSPIMFDKAATGPMTLPVDVESQVGEDPDVVWTGRLMDMGDPDVDVGPMMIGESATGPLSLPVVFNTETQADVRWEATLEVVPFVVGCGCPAGWLDCCMMDKTVLVPEMSPIVSMKSAVVPTVLPALSEVFSLAVLAGGVVAAAVRCLWSVRCL